jgi:hypothetical protein
LENTAGMKLFGWLAIGSTEAIWPLYIYQNQPGTGLKVIVENASTVDGSSYGWSVVAAKAGTNEGQIAAYPWNHNSGVFDGPGPTMGFAGATKFTGDGAGIRMFTYRAGAPIIFSTGGLLVTYEAMRITGDHNVGISNDIYTIPPTSFVPSYTGWTATPSIDCTYKQLGKTVTYNFYISGTGNTDGASGVSLSLPSPPLISGYIKQDVFVTDNSVVMTTPARTGNIVAGVASMNIYRAGDSAWVSTGTRTIAGQLIYDRQ